METIENESPMLGCSRALNPSQEFVAAIIALAADDCRAVTNAAPGRALSDAVIVTAASAAHFFLSEDGKAMILAVGMGREGLTAAEKLAHAALQRLRLPVEALEADNASWVKALTPLSPTTKPLPKLAAVLRGRQEAFGFLMEVA